MANYVDTILVSDVSYKVARNETKLGTWNKAEWYSLKNNEKFWYALEKNQRKKK